MLEDEWIPANIKQRECAVFCQFSKERTGSCKCWRRKSDHPDSGSRQTEEWTLSKNTRSVPCRHFGTIQFGDGKTSKFVRLDVKSPMKVVKTLLLDVWNLPNPKWIISIMGDKHKKDESSSDDLPKQKGDKHEKDESSSDDLPKQKGDKHENEESSSDELPKQKDLEIGIRHLMTTFSNGQNMWVTTEGINFGLAEMIGKALCDPSQETEKFVGNTSLLGLFGWGVCQKESRESLETGKSLEGNTEKNRPSSLYPHHILVDDGTKDPHFSNKTFQEFRMKLETSLGNPEDDSPSLPLVILLYGGWSYVIDGIVEAVENNVPIVILKGTGGFADVLANVFDNSKEDRINSTTSDNGQKWTGTVIDDRLRKYVEAQFRSANSNGEKYEAGQHKILQCLQKRELITAVKLDDKEETLANVVIKGLLKAKPFSEVLPILDYYMPAPMFEGEGTGSAVAKGLRSDHQGHEAMTSMFLFQALMLDLPEYAQFIIDYEGVTLAKFIKDKSSVFSETQETEYDDDYEILLKWAVKKGHQKCAALFWKKGNELLASALEMSVNLTSMMEKEENIGQKKTLSEYADLFQKRAVGLINECYNDNKEDTMKLIQFQAKNNIWTKNLFERCFRENNREIFATEAFRKYMDRVWYGKIHPPNMETYKQEKLQPDYSGESVTNKMTRIVLAPVATFSLNLMFYIAFLTMFGHTLLFELEPKYKLLEGILVYWWFTFVVEEVRQFWNIEIYEKEQKCACCIINKHFCLKLREYFIGNRWNILDFFCLLFFLIGAILMSVYHIDYSRTDIYQAARVFLSLDIMFFTWRLLQHVAISSVMGLVLVMIYEMVKDLFPFLVIMFVFIMSQGLAAHALLYPNRSWSPEAFLNIPKSAFWNIFGELGLDEIEANEPNDCSSNPLLFENDTINECPSELGKYAVPFLLGMYMLLMNTLLLNIVIARFSFTFQKIHDQAEVLAAWQQARVILEYYRKPPIPPPFNVFFHIGQALSRCICGRNKVDYDQKKETLGEDMASWERSMAECYLASAESKSGSERISIREKRETRGDPTNASPANFHQQESSTDPHPSPRILNQRTESASLTNGLTKRLKKMESAQMQMKSMLEELLRGSQRPVASVHNVGAMTLADVEDGEENV